MHGRSNLGFIFLIILFVVLLFVVIGRKKSEKVVYEEQQAETSSLVYPDLNVDAISQITISSLYSQVIEFKKIDGYWHVGAGGEHEIMKKSLEGEDGEDSEESAEQKEIRYYLADETRVVDGLLENIKKMPKGVKVSSDPEKQESTFQVGDALGIEITAKDVSNNVLAHFYVGKEADQMGLSNYMRFDDSGETYEVKQAWKNLVGGPLPTWRDKSLFAFNSAGINSLQILGGDDGYLVFTRDAEGEWSADVDWNIDGTKVDGVIQAMSVLEASDFGRIPNPEITGLDNPSKRIVASGDEGTFELYIGSIGDAGLYHCSTNEDDSIFMVPETSITSIFVGRDNLELVEAEPVKSPAEVIE